MIVIHSALLVAVQSQPPATLNCAARVTVALTLADVGAIVGAQVAPACVTVNVRPQLSAPSPAGRSSIRRDRVANGARRSRWHLR